MRKTVDTAERQGLDATGGKWVVICDAHGTIVNVRTKAIAVKVQTKDFCEECSNEVHSR